MKHLSRLKKKLRSSDSTNECSAQPTPVPAGASTSQTTTPSGHHASGSSPTIPTMGSSPISSPSNATPEPQIASSPPDEPGNNTPSIPERLWSKAYNILEEKEPDVVKGYREILERVQNEWNNIASPDELQSLQHCKSATSRQMWRLVYSGLERSKRQAKVKESVSNVMQTIENLKGVVDKAVKYSSEAAIAWAGVSLGLEILSNPLKEPGLNRKGIAYVLSRVEWYWNLAELVLQDNSSVSSAALRINLEAQIVDFYKKLLLFQMRSACLYYRNWAGVILRDVAKLDDWSGELNSIKDAENLMRNEIEQYDNQDIRLKLSTIETSASKQAESLESICLILREEARLREKNKQDEKDKDCLAALLITDPRMDKKRIQSQKGDPLRESYKWILENDAYQTFMDDASSRVLWINGPPGKGKTMLLCGIIDELQKSLRSISFFLCQANIKDEDLSSDTAVMRGLIYVLLEHHPSLIHVIRRSYDKQQDRLFNSINSSELLGDILTTMLQDSCLQDTILIVDALDECNINRTKLTNLIVNLSKSCNTKWIISSRDWPEIYQELVDATGFMSLDLEQEHESVSEAVKAYIRKKVDDLAKTKWKNDLELKEKVFDYMQSHADGTFLWVALVCERLANSGIRKRLVMEELMKFPTSLTALYQAMMNRITDSSEADRLKQILALACVVYRPIKSDEIPALVEPMAGYDEDDVKDAIASCGSFLTLQDKDIFFVHQSAKEFLLDQGHEVLFPRGMNHQHAHIFSRSLEAMENTLRQDIYELGSPGTLNPVEVRSPDPLRAVKYSCVFWALHLCESEPLRDPELLSLGILFKFLQSKFLNWLEALSLMGGLSTAITNIRLLRATLAGIEIPELIDFIYDAHRFIYHHKQAIEIAPLQVYCTALIFSPQTSVIRRRFSHLMPEWIIVKPEVDSLWENHIQTIYTRPDTHSASYSPDGCYLAVSCDFGFGLYETVSGDLVLEQKDLSSSPVAVYSPDGLFLCCLQSGNVFILDATTFGLVRKLKHEARQCLFLPEGNNIALVHSESVAVLNWKTGEALSELDRVVKAFSNIALLNTTNIVGISPAATEVKIWDLFTGECKHDLVWEVGEIGAVACSLDGHQIAAASVNRIRLWYWDNTLGWVHKHDLSNEAYVKCLIFSENGRMLISGSYDNLIRVWDETGGFVKLLRGHTQPIVFLSICGNQLASGSLDDTVRLWDLSDILSGQLRQRRRSSVLTCDYSSGAPLQSSYPGEHFEIDSLLFSPTGSMLASVSSTKTQIWDTATDICTDIILVGEPSGLDGVNFTPDDKLVAMRYAYGKLGVWNTEDMKLVQFSGFEGPGSVAISADGGYMSLLYISDTDGQSMLKVWDLIKEPQTQQHTSSPIPPMERGPIVSDFIHSGDWKALAVFDISRDLHIMHRKLGNWATEQVTHVFGEIPLAFSPDNIWLLTRHIYRHSFTIRELTDPYSVIDLGSLEADVTSRDTLPLEKPWWRIATRNGLLEIGEPRDFKGTARIGWGMSLEMDWIMRGNERMLWIPADYRRMALDINASRVAFVCPSGQIKIMRFR